MTAPDRTVKMLLGLIAIFLAILALRPVLTLASSANAQTVTATSDLVTIGQKVVEVSSIKVAEGKAVRGVYVVESAKCFIVQYDDHFQVYGLTDVKVPEGTTFKAPPSGPQLILSR